MTTYFFSLPDTEDLIDPSCSQKKNPTQLLGCMNPRQSGLTLEFTFGILKQLLPGRGEHLMARKPGRMRQEKTHVYVMILSHLP